MAIAALAGLGAWSRYEGTRKIEPARPAAVRNGRIVLSDVEQAQLPRTLRMLGVRSLLDLQRPIDYGGFAWNETGAHAGAIRISVDLRRQFMSVFRGGDEIGTAVILFGADGKPTPTGRFSILAKLKDHRSSLYDAPMPYTLRLTDGGVSIHGSHVREAAATHGCVGVPTEFARRLYAAVEMGDEVLITR